jgi:hypothetical protein
MMHREMIQVTDRQAKALKAEAARLATSVSDVIRRLLDAWIDTARRRV